MVVYGSHWWQMVTGGSRMMAAVGNYCWMVIPNGVRGYEVLVAGGT